MNETCRLPNGVLYEIDDDHCYVQTIFPDGGAQTGVPRFDPEDIERARSLGYQGTDHDAVWAMTRDHDLIHSLVAYCIDEGESHALRYHTRGVQQKGRIPLEERLCFLIQRALNTTTATDLAKETIA